MAGPFDLDPFLQRMAALDRAGIIAATIAEIAKYDGMQRSAKGAMRAATREHRQRLAAFLALMRYPAGLEAGDPNWESYRVVAEALRKREREGGGG
jgi:hypothetical protein